MTAKPKKQIYLSKRSGSPSREGWYPPGVGGLREKSRFTLKSQEKQASRPTQRTVPYVPFILAFSLGTQRTVPCAVVWRFYLQTVSGAPSADRLLTSSAPKDFSQFIVAPPSMRAAMTPTTITIKTDVPCLDKKCLQIRAVPTPSAPARNGAALGPC